MIAFHMYNFDKCPGIRIHAKFASSYEWVLLFPGNDLHPPIISSVGHAVEEHSSSGYHRSISKSFY